MWSVIIPTLWRSDLTQLLLKDLVENSYVGEVIIIDNAPESRPSFISKSSKLVILEQETNLFVNQSWNLGVKSSKFEKVCICNDDLNFNSSSLLKELSNLPFDDYILGCHSNCFNELDSNFNFSIMNGHSIGNGWGCILFFRKSNFIEIPNSLKIYFGDDWLAMKFNNVKSFEFPVLTKMSSTSSMEEFQLKIKSDYTSFSLLVNVFEKRFIRYSHVKEYNTMKRNGFKKVSKIIALFKCIFFVRDSSNLK